LSRIDASCPTLPVLGATRGATKVCLPSVPVASLRLSVVLVFSIAVLVFVIDRQRILYRRLADAIKRHRHRSQHRYDSFELHEAIDHEHGEANRSATSRRRSYPRRIQLTNGTRRVDRGRSWVRSCLPHFDYEHEHRFTEHEHDAPSVRKSVKCCRNFLVNGVAHRGLKHRCSQFIGQSKQGLPTPTLSLNGRN